MLFVVDDGHIRVGGSQAIVRTSEMLLEQLAPGDLVGVARLPTGVGSVEFTTDRQRVRDALRRPGRHVHRRRSVRSRFRSARPSRSRPATSTRGSAPSRASAPGMTDMSLAILRRRTRGRGAHRPHRGHRTRAADAALPRSAVHPAGPAEYAGQRRDAVGRPVPRARARQHGGRLAARRRGPRDAARRPAHAVDDGRRVAAPVRRA